MAEPHDLGARYRVEFDGFVGTVIGSYRRLDGEEGVVMQQDGCKVVHVYRRKWLKPAEGGVAAAPRFDPTLLARVPQEVLEAERTMSRWFAEQNIHEWKLGDCQNRTAGVTACPLKEDQPK